MPPRAVWHRIREQAEAEGLIRPPVSRRPSTWYLGGSLAAAIVVAVLMVPRMFDEEAVVYPTTPENVGTSSPIRLNTLQTLMTESRELESNLRDLPAKPRVMRAGTAAAKRRKMPIPWNCWQKMPSLCWTHWVSTPCTLSGYPSAV